jgi:hypothetical protein
LLRTPPKAAIPAQALHIQNRLEAVDRIPRPLWVVPAQLDRRSLPDAAVIFGKFGPKMTTAMTYIYRWERKGQACEILARGAMNGCLVKFDDGFTMVTSRNAIKKADRGEEPLADCP